MLKQAFVTVFAFSTTFAAAFGVALLLTPTSVQALTDEYCDNVIVHTADFSGKDKNIREPDVAGRQDCYGVGTSCKITHIGIPGGGYTVQCDVYYGS
jgi:hypothetical protein